LPSVTLDKEVFYRVSRLEHSAKKAHLDTGTSSLPSVVVWALGKEATCVECLLILSAKELTMGSLVISLPSASPAGTRQRGSHYRVPPNTLGKGPGKGAHEELLCRVLVQWSLGKE
jgi:hypothetical protein